MPIDPFQAMVVIARSPDETGDLARRIAPHLKPGMVVALSGDLGAGKSVFARALGGALHITGPMPSPTYNIVNEYTGSLPVLHVDLYRLSGEEEFELLGIDRMMASSVTLVEWPERVPDLLKNATVTVRIFFFYDESADDESADDESTDDELADGKHADRGPADDCRRITIDWAYADNRD